jgi:hypothetical protein
MPSWLTVVMVGVGALLAPGLEARAAVPLREALDQQGFMPDLCTLVEFEGTLNPALTNAPYSLAGAMPRNSPAHLPDGTAVAAYSPRFVPGHAGQGVLIEPGTRNHFSAAASGTFASLGEFTALGGAVLTTTDVNVLGGDAALQVTTPGQAIGEGFVVTATSTPPMAAESSVTGSLWLRGTGTVSLQLYDLSNYSPSAPLFATLTTNWQRYLIPPIKLHGAGASSFKMRVATATAAAAAFAADNLQLENRTYVTSWTAGGGTRANERVSYPLSYPAWTLTTGTIMMWVKTSWNEWTTLAWMTGDRGSFLYTAATQPHLGWVVYNRLQVCGYSGYPVIPHNADRDLFDGGWHFIAVSWSPGSVVACWNAATSAGSATTALSSAPEFLLGAWGTNDVVHATYDDWAVLKRALTAEELTALYQATK